MNLIGVLIMCIYYQKAAFAAVWQMHLSIMYFMAVVSESSDVIHVPWRAMCVRHAARIAAATIQRHASISSGGSDALYPTMNGRVSRIPAILCIAYSPRISVTGTW